MLRSLTALSVLLTSALVFSCSGGGSGDTPSAGPADGEAVYKTYCVACHGVDGQMKFGGAADLTQSSMPLDGRIEIVTHGQGAMNAFKSVLSEAEIRAVAEYSMTLSE